MTFVDAILKNTGCTQTAELKDLSPERRRQLAKAVVNFPAEKIPLRDWNEVLAAFGGTAAETQTEARIRLLRILCREAVQARQAEQTGAANPPVRAEQKAKTESRRKSPMQIFLRIWNICTGVLLTLVAVLAVALVGVRLFGLQVFTVREDSMEPEYRVGSLLYVKSAELQDLHVGDDITFMLDENTVATRRIVGTVPSGNDSSSVRFRTQGIANDHEDGSLVRYRSIMGKPVLSIPWLGYVADYIRNPPGTYVSIGIGAVLLGMIFLPDLFSGERENGEKDSRKIKSGRKNG